MKGMLLFLFIMIFCSVTHSQAFVIKMEVKDPNEVICSSKKIYALSSSMKGQVEAICPKTKTEILELLNNKVQFLKKNTKYNDEGLIRLVINCKGEVIQSKIYKNTKNEELDKQIKEVFNSLEQWESGKLNGKNVISSKLYKFKIENGKFFF